MSRGRSGPSWEHPRHGRSRSSSPGRSRGIGRGDRPRWRPAGAGQRGAAVAEPGGGIAAVEDGTESAVSAGLVNIAASRRARSEAGDRCRRSRRSITVNVVGTVLLLPRGGAAGWRLETAARAARS